jgi:hypothetical protein
MPIFLLHFHAESPFNSLRPAERTTWRIQQEILEMGTAMARILTNTLILVWLDNRQINNCTTALCTAGQDRDKPRTNSRVIIKALFHLRSKHMELHHLHQLQIHTNTRP